MRVFVVVGALAIGFMVAVLLLPHLAKAVGLPRWAAAIWLIVVLGLLAFMTAVATGWPP